MSVELSCEGAAEGETALAARLEALSLTLLEACARADRALSLVLTDDASIREVNARWRDQDSATDVLSFPVDPSEAALIPPPFTPLGDVIISLETCARDASALDFTTGEHALFLLIHGLCHLLGHDHGDAEEAARMRAEEDRLLALVAPGQRRPPTPY